MDGTPQRAPRPLGLLAELTHRCPLGCPYCSNPLALESRAGELDTATWARVFKAEGPAHEIIKRCTGEATVNEIVDDLAKTFNAPRDRIMTDVSAMLTVLVDKQLMET